MTQKVPMTAKGAEQLRQELERLKTVERRNIIEKIAEARAHGDLKENAEYHAAKEKQSFIEGKIKELEAKLSHAQVINVSTILNKGKVIFGATVTLENIASGERVTYQIVGEDEADLKVAKISVNSPIARALIGKEVQDVASVITPNGTVEYEIIAIQYI